MRSEAGVCVKLEPGNAFINVSSDRKSRAVCPLTARSPFGPTVRVWGPCSTSLARIRRLHEASRITRWHEKAAFLDVCQIDRPKVEVKQNIDGSAWMKASSKPLPVLHEGEAGAPFVASSAIAASVGSVRNCPRFI